MSLFCYVIYGSRGLQKGRPSMKERTKKRVIIARHGESTANASLVHQGRNATLTTRGVIQATYVGAAFEKRGVTALVSSNEPRSIQTMQPAASRLGITPEISELFNERRRPSLTIGLHADDPAAKMAMSLVDAGGRYSDEESVSELLDRAHLIFQFLEEHPSDCLGITSHAHLLRALHTLVYTRFNATNRDYQLAYDTLRVDNGGLCIFEFGKGHKSQTWWWHIVTWNETGHLS